MYDEALEQLEELEETYMELKTTDVVFLKNSGYHSFSGCGIGVWGFQKSEQRFFQL